MNADAATSIFVTAQDGLKLHVRNYGPRLASALPVVCLPGLARTVADFTALATALAGDPKTPRRVLALDSRGRGMSDYDRNPTNYSLQVELADVLAMLTALGIARAIFVGTSRGGILTMLLATARPTAIAGCVLNDIGPVIESKGLMRIKSYVGKLPRPASFHEAADLLRRLFGSQFTKLSDDDWVGFARSTFKEAGGRIVPDYDAKLASTLKGVNPDRPLPALWKEFDALARVPVMVIRGGNSDILSVATVEAMRARRDRLDVVEVPDEGHAPLLTGADTIGPITAFVAACDRPGPDRPKAQVDQGITRDNGSTEKLAGAAPA
jgi:pimeloyl-ACP methyl ester carboxylesterase